jgi:hypothetical protein
MYLSIQILIVLKQDPKTPMQEVVFRKPLCSATKKSGVYCVRNISEMVLFLSKEYVDKNITFSRIFVRDLYPISS